MVFRSLNQLIANFIQNLLHIVLPYSVSILRILRNLFLISMFFLMQNSGDKYQWIVLFLQFRNEKLSSQKCTWASLKHEFLKCKSHISHRKSDHMLSMHYTENHFHARLYFCFTQMHKSITVLIPRERMEYLLSFKCVCLVINPAFVA